MCNIKKFSLWVKQSFCCVVESITKPIDCKKREKQNCHRDFPKLWFRKYFAMEVQNVSWHKDEESALLYRIEGNHFLKKKKFFETLLSYNQSLCNATPDSEEMGFAYSNRSIVYLDVHEYKLCLDNIELARASAYPASKLPVLEAREEKCKRIIEGIKKTEGVDTFFKLSHPANQKIPFIAKCLELRKNKQFGRHIITNKGKLKHYVGFHIFDCANFFTDLQSGDIIAIEEPFFKSADGDGIFTRCTFCLRSNKMSLIPSDISSQGKQFWPHNQHQF